MRNTHQIKTIELDLEFDDHEMVAELHQRMNALCNDTLPHLLDDLFGKSVGADTVLKIDSLEIDLGSMAFANMEEGFIQNIEMKMSDILQNSAPDRQNSHPVISGESTGKTSAKAISITDHNLEILHHFLRYGVVPWNSFQFNLAAAFADYLSLIRVDRLERKWLLSQLKDNPGIRERIIYHLSDDEIARIISLWPENVLPDDIVGNLKKLQLSITKSLTDKIPLYTMRSVFWRTVIEFLTRQETTDLPMSALADDLSYSFNIPLAQITEAVAESEQNAPESLKRRREPDKNSLGIEVIHKVLLGEIAPVSSGFSDAVDLYEYLYESLRKNKKERVWLQNTLTTMPLCLQVITKLFDDNQVVELVRLLEGGKEFILSKDKAIRLLSQATTKMADRFRVSVPTLRFHIWRAIVAQLKYNTNHSPDVFLSETCLHFSATLNVPVKEVVSLALEHNWFKGSTAKELSTYLDKEVSQDQQLVSELIHDLLSGKVSPDETELSDREVVHSNLLKLLTKNKREKIWLQEQLFLNLPVLQRVCELFSDEQIVEVLVILEGKTPFTSFKQEITRLLEVIPAILSSQLHIDYQRLQVWQTIVNVLRQGHIESGIAFRTEFYNSLSLTLGISVEKLIQVSLEHGVDDSHMPSLRGATRRSNPIGNQEVEGSRAHFMSPRGGPAITYSTINQLLTLKGINTKPSAVGSNIPLAGKLGVDDEKLNVGETITSAGYFQPQSPERLYDIMRENISPSQPTRIQHEQSVDVFSNIEDQISHDFHIDNAGLILIAPFLSGLFNNLEFTKDNAFKGPEFQMRALHISQYLCTGESSAFEYELVLNKILCGLPLNFPVPFDMDLTGQEKKEADKLLGAVITHWQALKNTSPQGLRNSFLQRKGILSREKGTWCLRVERKTIDILLEQLPWSYSIIKLDWMNTMLTVEW